MNSKALTVLLGTAGLALASSAWADSNRTPFTGTETLQWPEFGTQFTDGQTLMATGFRFHAREEMTDSRVCGASTIGWNAIVQLESFAGPQWGTFHLENDGGAWDGFWYGSISSSDGHVLDNLVCTATGSGGYEGLVARWAYTGQDFSQGGPLYAEGYIVEEKGGRTDLPIQSKSWGMDTGQTILGVYLDPETGEILGQGAMVCLEIIEFGQASHLGRFAEQGYGIFQPLSLTSGAVAGAGVYTAANGDLLYWVATGTSVMADDGQSATFDGTGHFAGGTGKFAAATGGFPMHFNEKVEPPTDPLVSTFTYSYRVRAAIRY
jgi:hypothetical protein